MNSNFIRFITLIPLIPYTNKSDKIVVKIISIIGIVTCGIISIYTSIKIGYSIENYFYDKKSCIKNNTTEILTKQTNIKKKSVFFMDILHNKQEKKNYCKNNANLLVNNQINNLMNEQTDEQTDNQTDEQTDNQIDEQTDEQTDNQIDDFVADTKKLELNFESKLTLYDDNNDFNNYLFYIAK